MNFKYNLPKKTRKLALLYDEISKQKTVDLQYQKMFEFINECFDDEKIEELLGTLDLDEIDLTEMTLLVNDIALKWEEPIVNESIDYMQRIMKKKDLQKTINTLSNLASEMKK